jgi:hypothetical protein
MTFDEDETFKISRESYMDEDREEWEAQRDAYLVDCTLHEHILEYQNEIVEPKRPIDPPKEAIVSWKRSTWLRITLQEDEGHANPKGSFRESKRPHKFSSYVVLMRKIIDSEPSTFEEVVSNKSGRMP